MGSKSESRDDRCDFCLERGKAAGELGVSAGECCDVGAWARNRGEADAGQRPPCARVCPARRCWRQRPGRDECGGGGGGDIVATGKHDLVRRARVARSCQGWAEAVKGHGYRVDKAQAATSLHPLNRYIYLWGGLFFAPAKDRRLV
jgi:hypothetical protein